jgi:hypothetical protein
MKKPLAFALFLACTIVPVTAFAQSPTVPGLGSPNLTPAVGVIAALSMLAGLITNWVQTGTLLGRWVTPKSWLPDLTLASTWLGGFVGYLASQNPPSLSGANLFWATITAMGMLTAGALPAGAHYAHTSLNAKTRELLKAAAKATAAVGLFLGLGTTQLACSQPVLPLVTNVANVVLNDLKAGDSDVQIDSDVCKALGGSATTDAVCAGVTVVVNDAIAILIDTGILTGTALDRGKSYLAAHPVVATGGK